LDRGALSRLAASLLVALSTAGCLRNPVTQKRQTRLISEASEREIGSKTRDELVREYGELSDEGLRNYVSELGRKLAMVSDRPRVDYVFTILDSDVVNAFAAPGGYIFVTRGLLQRMDNEAELAAVLGHEIGHVCALHSVTMIQKQMGAGILTVLGTIAAGVTAGPEASMAVLQSASLFGDLYLLGYSRDNELEADRIGLRYALSAGYDARAALTFFEKLKALEVQAGMEEWEPYLLSHPPADSRIALAKDYVARMEEFPRAPSVVSGRFALVSERLALLPPGRLGVVKGGRFSHAGSGATVTIPDGWSWEVHNQSVLAGFRSPVGGAWGELRRRTLAEPMRAEEFAALFAQERRWKFVQGREAIYPVGYVFLGGFAGEGPMGGGYQIRALFATRGRTGYVLACAAPPDAFENFLLPFEGIMRSFVINGRDVNVIGKDGSDVESDLRDPVLQRKIDHRDGDRPGPGRGGPPRDPRR
jgi:predicted Zn-dependent protease